MCYSLGRFETHMGDCRVRDYNKFELEMHINACIACQGYDFDTVQALETGQIKEENLLSDEDLQAIARDAIDKKLVF